MAVLLGILCAAILGVLFGMNWLLAIVLGILVALLGAWFLATFLCGEGELFGGNDIAKGAAASAAAPMACMPEPLQGEDGDKAEADAKEKAAEPAAPAEPASAPTAKAEPEAEHVGSEAKPGGQWTGSGNGLRRVAEDDGASTEDAKPEDSTPAAPDATVADAAKTPAPVAGETEPALFEAAPSDADDLKRIKGVGPGLEKTLNEMGIYTFEQIAGWGDAEIAWVDARLKFKGRILRDNWVSQAKTFASEA